MLMVPLCGKVFAKFLKGEMKMKKFLFAVILAVAVVAAGCSQGSKGATVATVNGKAITESDIQAKLDSIPAEYRMMMQGPEGKKRILDQLVLTELIIGFIMHSSGRRA